MVMLRSILSLCIPYVKDLSCMAIAREKLIYRYLIFVKVTLFKSIDYHTKELFF